MDRAEAITKIKSLRNVNGRTPGEAEMFLAKATELMAKYGVTEHELAAPVWFAAQPRMKTEHDEFMERMRQAAADAAFWARMAKAQGQTSQQQQRTYSPPPPPKRPAGRKAPNRDPFKGSVPPGKVHPDRWQSLMNELGLRTKGDLAKACRVSSSLVSEWFGKGRGRLAWEWEFDMYAATARGQR